MVKGPPRHWHQGEAFPEDIADHVRQGGKFVCHNAAFERSMWNNCLRRMFPDLPELRIEQQDCTVARAAVLGIPAGLEFVGQVLGLTQQKDMDGTKAMMRMAKPSARNVCPKCYGRGCAACDFEGYSYVFHTDWQTYARSIAYCHQDVEAESAVDATVPPLSPRERKVWELDQHINDRGFRLDVRLIHKAVAIAEYAGRQLDRRLLELTDGFVPAVTNATKLTQWLQGQGLDCKGVAKGEIDDLICQAQSAGRTDILEVLEIRQSAKSSVKKLQAMLACVGSDSRARGQLQYHGAFSGRKAGRLIQPQNLHRPDGDDGGDLDAAITLQIINSAPTPGDGYRAMDMILSRHATKKAPAAWYSPLAMIAKAIRLFIVAAPNHRFIGGDLSNIEGRAAAWIAGESWKVDAFAALDVNPSDKSLDLYRRSYANSFGVHPADVTKTQRQVGKVQELALQYQGAVHAFMSMAVNLRVDLTEIADAVYAAVDPGEWAMVQGEFAKAREKYGLSVTVWTALTIIVRNWRARHPRIVAGWYGLQDAAIAAVCSPGTMVEALEGRVSYVCSHGFLWCRLPSGRVLAYFKPRIEIDHIERERSDGSKYKIEKKRVVYWGYEGEKKRFTEVSLYGGIQFNHIVQGTARDILAEMAFDAEAQGYKIVLEVHDELLTEVPIGTAHSADGLKNILSTVPWFVQGLPLSAAAWEGARYEK